MGAKLTAASLLAALMSICVWVAQAAVAQPYHSQAASAVIAYTTLPPEPLSTPPEAAPSVSTSPGQESREPADGDAIAPPEGASPENPSATALSGAEVGSTEATATTGGSAAIAWGENYRGQLGTIYKDHHEEFPVAVEGLSNIQTAAAAESFNLALLTDGTVASWGTDRFGQLGDDAFKANWEREKSHSMVIGLSGVKAIAATELHAMALLPDGTVQAWGQNSLGELGQGVAGFENNTGINSRIPSAVPGLKEVAAISAGGPADYALLENGEIEAWGGNPMGQLGVPWPEQCEKNMQQPGCASYECITEVGVELCSARPKLVVDGSGAPITGVAAASAGQEAAYALLKTGEVLSWGSNRFGALGQANVPNGYNTHFEPPGKVMRTPTQPLNNVAEISAGFEHTLALLKNGEVVGWGGNEMGGLGKQPNSVCSNTPCMTLATPISLPNGVKAEAVAAGNRYSLVLAQHKVYAVGRNENGELGNGTTSISRSPVLVKTPGPVKAISAGNTHALALLEPGTESPHPAVTLQPKVGAVRIGWPTEAANRLLYRVFERPGPEEFEEEPEKGAAEEPERGEGHGPPSDITLPKITHEPRLPGNGTVAGQNQVGATGAWSGTEPFKFSYQWQRCKEAQCHPIVGATRPIYEAGAADVTFVLRLVVMAKNSVEPNWVAACSEPTSIVKSEAEGRRAPAESITLGPTQQSMLVNNLFGVPLAPIQYEFKVQSSRTGQSRTVISRPAL